MEFGLKYSAEGCVARQTCCSPCRTTMGGASFRWWLLLLLCGMIIGCAGMKPAYQGTPARPDNRFPLAPMDGTPATWQAKDIALHYQSVVNNGGLAINGTVERLNTIKHFDHVDYFRVSIHVLNAEGIILNTHLLWATGRGQNTKIVRWTFEKNLPLPAGAMAIGFSYSGALLDGGGDSGGTAGWDVRQKP